MSSRPDRFEELTPEELLGPLNEFEKKNAPPRLYVAGDRGLRRTARLDRRVEKAVEAGDL